MRAQEINLFKVGVIIDEDSKAFTVALIYGEEGQLESVEKENTKRVDSNTRGTPFRGGSEE